MIKLEQVNFVYNNTKPDTGVHNINLQIPKGQVVLRFGILKNGTNKRGEFVEFTYFCI